MKKILIICCLFFAFSLPQKTFAIDERVETAYETFLSNIEKKYSQEQQLHLLEQVRDKILDIQFQGKYPDRQNVTDDLRSLNNEEIFHLWRKDELSNAKQIVNELRERKTLEVSLEKSTHPSAVQTLIDAGFTFISSSEGREFVSGDSIKRIIHSRYFPIDESSLDQLLEKDGIVLYDGATSEYQFIEDYTLEEKIPYSELTEKFNIYITDNYKIHEENNAFYGYNFLNTKFYNGNYGIYQESLDASGFSYDTTILLKRDDGGYSFITDYSEYKIANQDDVFGVSEKHLFLDYLREDSKFPTTNISAELQKMKSLSRELTAGKDYSEGLNAIYAWILENVSYTTEIDLEDEQIFSGIEAFKTGSGVCTGYTKLSSYILYYAGYYDVEVIRGHVIDAQDFPQIGHAWLKIGDRYYDPTFDDPIGAVETKTASEYKYFGLPEDVFYANRYDFGELPTYLETASKQEIKSHIFDNLSQLLPKYESQLDTYPVFGEISFKNLNNISATTTITPSLLASKIGSFSVENNSFRYTNNNGTQEAITSFKYFTIDDSNTEAVLDLLGYKTDTLTLFDWQLENGSRNWRLAYELELR